MSNIRQIYTTVSPSNLEEYFREGGITIDGTFYHLPPREDLSRDSNRYNSKYLMRDLFPDIWTIYNQYGSATALRIYEDLYQLEGDYRGRDLVTLSVDASNRIFQVTRSENLIVTAGFYEGTFERVLHTRRVPDILPYEFWTGDLSDTKSLILDPEGPYVYTYGVNIPRLNTVGLGGLYVEITLSMRGTIQSRLSIDRGNTCIPLPIRTGVHRRSIHLLDEGETTITQFLFSVIEELDTLSVEEMNSYLYDVRTIFLRPISLREYFEVTGLKEGNSDSRLVDFAKSVYGEGFSVEGDLLRQSLTISTEFTFNDLFEFLESTDICSCRPYIYRELPKYLKDGITDALRITRGGYQ